MKRYRGLFERVVCFENLFKAAHRAFAGKKDNERVARFYFHLETELLSLEQELKEGTYQMAPYRKFKVYEPKERQICAADFRDRVVHHAICQVLEPIWDRTLIFDTYACRKDKGTHQAIQRAQEFCRKYPFYFKCDIRKYFESIDHECLKRILRKKIKDVPLLNLLDQIIDDSGNESPPGKGVPIGNLTSQHFANLYLGELDQLLKSGSGVKGYLRYMDDLLCFGNSKGELDERKTQIEAFLQYPLKLELKTKASRLAPVSEGIPFLGVRIFPATIRLQRERWIRFQRKLKQREKELTHGLLEEDQFLHSVRGLIEQARWGDTLRLRQGFFKNRIVFQTILE
ncbi:reverse transcriptase domain-containing protein [Deltaproteobacteria bacterium TL4]